MQKLKYTVTYSKGSYKSTGEFERPFALPQPGEVYEAVKSFQTLGGTMYHRGDKFKVLNRTDDAPYHRTSSLGNLLIKCKDKTSVWSSFEAAIADGWIQYVL